MHHDDAIVRDKSASEKYFKDVIAYEGRSVGHPVLLVQLLAARNLNDTEAAERLLDDSRNASDSMSKWALDRFNGNRNSQVPDDIKVSILEKLF